LQFAAGAATTVVAPDNARTWVLGTAVAAWCCVAVAVAVASSQLRRARRDAAARGGELEMTKHNWMQQSAEASQLVSVTLPEIAKRVKNGASAAEALPGVPAPSDPHQRQMLHLFAAELAESVRRRDDAQAELRALRGELARGTEEM
ncbi:ATP-binding protein, partial [Streptomyces sp. DSM 41636]|nr:ATP-binding protein [Streptomyces sp. DSM 41636]